MRQFGWRSAATALGFCAVLVVATFFSGDIGVYNDDYYWNQRDALGQIHHWTLHHAWHMWRPLARVLFAPIVTAFWNHPWMLHALDAATHGLIVWMLYALLRKLRIAPAVAAPVALGFLVYPVHFEAVLWIGVTPTLFAAAFLLAIWHAYLLWLERAPRLRAPARLGLLASMGLLAFGSAALNEQPVGALAAMPLALLAVPLEPGVPLRRRAMRGGVPIAVVLGSLALYGWGFLSHARVVETHGQAETDVSQLPRNALHLAARIPSDLALGEFGRGAWDEGLLALAEHPARSIVAGLVLLLGALWFVLIPGPASKLPERDNPSSVRPLVLAALGAAWFLGAWIPVAFLHGRTVPRLYYVPSMGLAISVAAVLGVLASRAVAAGPRASWARPAASTIFAAAIGAALIVWIGAQENFKRRFLADQAEIAPIVSALKDTIEPDCYLLPVRLSSRTAQTGDRRFDEYFQPCWSWWYASGWRAQSAFRNPRVYSIRTAAGVQADGLWLSSDDPLHVGIMRSVLAPPVPHDARLKLAKAPGGGNFIPWDRAVFFEVLAPGQTRLITRLRLHPPGTDPVEIVPRQIARAPGSAALTEDVLDVYPAP